VVAAPRSVPGRLPFALLVTGILGSGLVALLLLHTLAAQDAFTLHHLQHESATLADSEQQLGVAEQQAQAPSAVAARARALGMVPAGALRIVHRRDGRVVAVSIGVARPVPKPAATPTPTPAASASAKPTTTTASPAAANKPRPGGRTTPSPPH
jgi:hypothetical protein